MIELVATGPLLSVQDLGRPAARRYGVPVGGAMDAFALAAANRLVGNPPHSAGLEITAGGAELRFARSTLIALTGAALGARLDGRPLPPWTATPVGPHASLRLPGRDGPWGARAYLAVAGGIDVPVVLGSRSTELGSAFGGRDGRALRPGDRLPLGPPGPHAAFAAGLCWPELLRPPYASSPTLRFLPGPHLACFAADQLELLAATPLRLSPAANRMGYRLDGLRLRYARPCSLASLGVVPGAIQIPPDGAPILLMADAQTTGGYPLLGTVIAADLPLAAQLLPGDALWLAPVTLDEALAARQTLATALAHLLVGPDGSDGDLLALLAGAPG